MTAKPERLEDSLYVTAPVSERDDELVGLYPGLLRFAAVCGRGAGDADDLVQEAMTRLLARPAVFGRVKNCEAYLVRVIARLAAAEGRRRSRFVLGAGADRSMSTDPSGGGTVASLLAELPSRQRACLYLRYIRDFSVAQTAELLGCSEGTVKSQTARALEKLRADAAPTCEPDPRNRSEARPGG